MNVCYWISGYVFVLKEVVTKKQVVQTETVANWTCTEVKCTDVNMTVWDWYPQCSHVWQGVVQSLTVMLTWHALLAGRSNHWHWCWHDIVWQVPTVQSWLAGGNTVTNTDATVAQHILDEANHRLKERVAEYFKKPAEHLQSFSKF